MFGGGTDTAVFTVVENGIPGQLMLRFRQLPVDERWAIITFIRSRGGLPSPLAETIFRPPSEKETAPPRQGSPTVVQGPFATPQTPTTNLQAPPTTVQPSASGSQKGGKANEKQ